MKKLKPVPTFKSGVEQRKLWQTREASKSDLADQRR
jgi:hypothetical protein